MVGKNLVFKKRSMFTNRWEINVISIHLPAEPFLMFLPLENQRFGSKHKTFRISFNTGGI